MSFLGVKVILFLEIPLIIKEKSNASALRPLRDNISMLSPDFINAFAQFYHYFYRIIPLISSNYTIVFRTSCPCLQKAEKKTINGVQAY